MSGHDRVLRMLTKMRTRIATLEAENKRLREALDGAAEIAADYEPYAAKLIRALKE